MPVSAQIRLPSSLLPDGELVDLGTFLDEDAASAAYDHAARVLNASLPDLNIPLKRPHLLPAGAAGKLGAPVFIGLLGVAPRERLAGFYQCLSSETALVEPDGGWPDVDGLLEVHGAERVFAKIVERYGVRMLIEADERLLSAAPALAPAPVPPAPAPAPPTTQEAAEALVGRKIAKVFDDKLFEGTVIEAWRSSGKWCWQVEYEDGDAEDMEFNELFDTLLADTS